jgi:hypothetical protein
MVVVVVVVVGGRDGRSHWRGLNKRVKVAPRCCKRVHVGLCPCQPARSRRVVELCGCELGERNDSDDMPHLPRATTVSECAVERALAGSASGKERTESACWGRGWPGRIARWEERVVHRALTNVPQSLFLSHTSKLVREGTITRRRLAPIGLLWSVARAHHRRVVEA